MEWFDADDPWARLPAWRWGMAYADMFHDELMTERPNTSV